MGACCYNGGCADTDSEWCRIYGDSYAGDDTECDWYDCLLHAKLGGCCDPLLECHDKKTEAACADIGGPWFERTPCSLINCEPPPNLGCCGAREDRKLPDKRDWTLDRCANVVAVPMPRPDSVLFDVVTAHPIRAVALPAAQDPCLHYRARMTLDEYGRGQVVLCNRPARDDPQGDYMRYSRLTPYLRGRHDVENTDERTGGFFGTYQTPGWTELMYRSWPLYCVAVKV